MSWLATPASMRTLGDALALRPGLLAGFRAFEAAAADPAVLDPALRAAYRRRVATLVGGRTGPADARAASDREAIVVEFAEQVVLDPHGVTDELVARLPAHCTPREIVAIAQDVAVTEGLARLARLLDVAPLL